MDNKDEHKDIHSRFDRLEIIWKRSQKLILSVIGGVGLVIGAIVLLINQYKTEPEDKSEIETESSVVDYYDEAGYYMEDVADQQDQGYYITKKTYMVDDYGYRIGDTIYIDYYSDGIIDRYYTDGETYIDK